METFESISQELRQLISEWEVKLLTLDTEVYTTRKNSQNRTIKQIVGHMVDSASNNTHRIVHLQYGENPLTFPNYATHGNNDRWIAIQNYQNENWKELIQLWKYSHLHITHVFLNMNPEKLENKWMSNSKYGDITLKAMVEDFPKHFKLHIGEIEELISG
jgi:hypothetical protein